MLSTLYFLWLVLSFPASAGPYDSSVSNSVVSLVEVGQELDFELLADKRKAPHDFWKLESERSGEITVATFSAKKEPGKGQGLLLCAQWPKTEAPQPELEPTVVLAGLYNDLKEFQLLGSKEALWGEKPARLIAFKAVVEKRPVLGRALMTQASSGTEILLLVTNHEAQKDFMKEFDRLQRHWTFGGAAASNVLYSH